MKKKLTLAQIILLLLSALFPFLDWMFTWRTYNTFFNISERYLSLHNLATVQEIGAGPALFYIFIAAIALVLLLCIWELFSEKTFENVGATILAHSLCLALAVILIVTVSAHKETFNWRGEWRNVAVISGVLAYVEMVILAATTIIECYKRFKCVPPPAVNQQEPVNDFAAKAQSFYDVSQTTASNEADEIVEQEPPVQPHTADRWSCICGKNHAAYVFTCPCGKNRHDTI